MKKKLENIFFPNDRKPDHVKSLDGLRGIAILTVLLAHGSAMNMMFHPYLNFSGTGLLGVGLFFILSAYLLDRQIAIAYLSDDVSRSFWLNYFFRRFLRIYPLFIVALFLYWPLTHYGLIETIPRFLYIPLHLMLIKGNGIFWSIIVEFKYYLVSPLIMWFCHYYLKWSLKAVVMTLSVLVLVSAFVAIRFELPRLSTIRYLPFFLTGTLISVYELLKKEPGLIFRNSKVWNVVGGVSFCAIIATTPEFFRKVSGREYDFLHPVFYLPYTFLWGLILVSSKVSSGIFRYVLEMKVLRFFGTISYSLYLFHFPFQMWIASENAVPKNAKIYVFLFLSVCTACLTYLLIERPLAKFKIKSGSKKGFDILSSVSGSNIRSYKKEDRHKVIELLRLNTPKYFAPEEERDLEHYLDQELELYYVVQIHDEIVGCGGINFWEDKTTGVISWDIFHPHFQGKGIGKELLNYRIDIIRSFKDVKSICVRTSQLAYKFYQKQGFELEETSKDYWAEGLDLYKMKYKG